ncbi:MAG: protein kinase [Okeania sp. SIO2H7]|nr:protein kinase [Okeania sp. SIO2H7]
MYNPGKKLKKRPYQIESILGQGGFSITYKARHLDLDFPVVLKTPNATLKQDKNFQKYVQRFKKEGKILAKISGNSHPNIVRISDLFEENGIPCLVMDYLPGDNLYNLIQQQGILSEETAINYIRQIGSALSVCHQAGIIHKDATPVNMMLRENNNIPVLIDFGIAGTVGTQTMTKSHNPAFAPWEQMLQGEKAPTVDVYSLAASLYYLLTGKTPTPCFDRKLTNKELVSPKRFNSSIGDELNQAIFKGMAVEPEDRPQSVEEWLKLLSSQQESGEKVELRSDVGIDYSQLEKLLAIGNWMEADKETRRAIFQGAEKREEDDYLDGKELLNFPDTDLETIDRLWVKYSDGKFGFSVQKQIWESLGSGTDDRAFRQLGDRLGWYNYYGDCLMGADLTWDKQKAPPGHLPWGTRMLVWVWLLRELETLEDELYDLLMEDLEKEDFWYGLSLKDLDPSTYEDDPYGVYDDW